MKKFIFLQVLIILSYCQVFSQVLTLSNAEHPDIPNGSTISVPGYPSDDDVEVKVYITNNDNVVHDVKVKKTHIQIVDGSQNTFCWGSCFQYEIWESPFSIPIEPGQTDIISFAGHYYPNGNDGISIVAYTFFDVGRSNDTVMFRAAYLDNTSEIEIPGGTTDYCSVPYPNPAQTYVRFSYSISSLSDGYLHIYDITGKEMEKIELSVNPGILAINTEEFESGLYLYRIINDGILVKTGKLTICR